MDKIIAEALYITVVMDVDTSVDILVKAPLDLDIHFSIRTGIRRKLPFRNQFFNM